MYDMLKNMDPPLGFGSKCPDRLAFKKLIRMNQPIDDEGMVHFTTTLFALIRENLSIKMRAAEEMDQADYELRQTIIKVWPYEGKEKIDLLVPPPEGKKKKAPGKVNSNLSCYPTKLFFGKKHASLSYYLSIPYRGSGMIDHFVAPH